MSKNKTTNLTLHSWDATDQVKRTEFNENFNKIDDKIGILLDSVAYVESFSLIVPETDDTERIKRAFASLTNGGRIKFSPKKTYTVKENVLVSNSNIVVEGKATIKQVTSSTDTWSNAHSLSNYPMFKFTGSNIKIKGLKFIPVYEAIHTSGADDVTIQDVTVDGEGNGKFSGMFLDGSNIKVFHSKIKNCGIKPTWNVALGQSNYGSGHGIHISLGSDVKIKNCTVTDNGANGVFTFASKTIMVAKNTIKRNGMSGYQAGFGSSETDQYDHIIEGNIITDNNADGIDINNATGAGTLNFGCVIKGNILKNNGFLNGNVTQDGSGIATLKSIKNIVVIGNICENSARAGFYAVDCEDIIFQGNKIKKSNSVNEAAYFNNVTGLQIQGNIIRVVGEGIKLDGNITDVKMNQNEVYTTGGYPLSLPNSLVISKYDISHNTFVGTVAINGIIDMNFNHIESTTVNDAIGINVDGLSFNGNRIIGTSKGLVVNGRTNIRLTNNKIIGSNGDALNISGGTNIYLFNNHTKAESGAGASLRVTGNATEVYLIQNDIEGASGGNDLKTEAGTTVYMDRNYVHGGFTDLTTATIKRLTWA